MPLITHQTPIQLYYFHLSYLYLTKPFFIKMYIDVTSHRSGTSNGMYEYIICRGRLTLIKIITRSLIPRRVNLSCSNKTTAPPCSSFYMVWYIKICIYCHNRKSHFIFISKQAFVTTITSETSQSLRENCRDLFVWNSMINLDTIFVRHSL